MGQAPIIKASDGKEVLTVKIREVYQGIRGVYGSPRITRHLGNNGMRVSQPGVARLMKKIGLKSLTTVMDLADRKIIGWSLS